MENYISKNEQTASGVLKIAGFVEKVNLPYKVGLITMIVMLLWAGAYKMTAPGAEGIIPLVSNSPFISWHFKLFGPYIGSDLIGVTEWLAAIGILVGQYRPKIGVIGASIAILMFSTTSSMLVTTPDTIVNVNGISYMSFLGLFLFKDLIALALSLYLMVEFKKKAQEDTKTKTQSEIGKLIETI